MINAIAIALLHNLTCPAKKNKVCLNFSCEFIEKIIVKLYGNFITGLAHHLELDLPKNKRKPVSIILA